MIYDLLGRQVAQLAEGIQAAGKYEVTWDGGNRATGVYFAELRVVDAQGRALYSKIDKLILMK